MKSHLFKYRLKSGSEDRVRQWQEYAVSNRAEILETLLSEGVEVEDAFYETTSGGEMYLYYYIRSLDLAKAQELFKSSEKAVDIYQREFFSEVIESGGEIERVVGLSGE